MLMIDADQMFRDAMVAVIDMDSATAALAALENIATCWTDRPDYLATIDKAAASLRESQKVSRRKRVKVKGPPTIKQIEKETGKNVSAATYTADGRISRVSFGSPDQSSVTPLDTWRAKRRGAS
jgi:hypothetical protein